jgi:hypothetical protein
VGDHPPGTSPARAGDTAPAQQTTRPTGSSRHLWERVEALGRAQIQRFIQALVEEEGTALLGRPTSTRRAAVDAATGLRNGEGSPRRFTLPAGTIAVRRPRVRGLDERFVSRVLPLYTRRLSGALAEGRQVVLAVESGQRAAKEPRGAVLRDLGARGRRPWRWTTAAAQRGWHHRVTHVWEAMPPKHQAQARTL